MDYSALSSEELVVACLARGDEQVWAEFVRRFQPLISIVVLRTARRRGDTSPDLLDDLIQETFLKLCADRESLLRKFRPDHPDSIFGYIKVLTTNLVHDYFKALHSQKRGRNLTSTLSDEDGPVESSRPSLSDAEAIERKVLISQIEAALNALDTGLNSRRDRRIFWLHYRTGLSASAIAAVPGIGLTTKGVESILFRLTRQVKEKLCQGGQKPCEGPPNNEGIRPAESF